MGVVRQAVKMSAGRVSVWGRISLASQAARMMVSFMKSSTGAGMPWYWGICALSCTQPNIKFESSIKGLVKRMPEIHKL